MSLIRSVRTDCGILVLFYLPGSVFGLSEVKKNNKKTKHTLRVEEWWQNSIKTNELNSSFVIPEKYDVSIVMDINKKSTGENVHANVSLQINSLSTQLQSHFSLSNVD